MIMQVTMKSEPLSTNGEPIKIGEQLPDFKVKSLMVQLHQALIWLIRLH